MTAQLELVGVEKMKDLGYDSASMADAREIYDAMAAVDSDRIPRLENTISYAARDNAGNWYELRAGEWVKYVGPGRVANEKVE